MDGEILIVKNMVCHRCVLAVEDVLNELSIPFHNVTAGEVHLAAELETAKLSVLKERLLSIGLELLDNRRSGMMERIKQLVIKKARNEVTPADNKKTLSQYLSDHLFHEYTYLSSLFSSIEGRTIENYYILQRIEKVKELLVYGELNLSEIATDMQYSSVAHLSNQFKKITGLTPTHFLKIATERRQLLDHI